MSLKFRFKLDGVVMQNEPANLNEFTMTLRRSEEIRGVIREYSTNIVLYGSDYTTVAEMFENNEWNGPKEFIAEYTVDYTTYTAFITANVWSERIELNPQKREAKITLEDRAFTSQLYNNRDLPIDLTSGTTLNGEVITPVTDIIIHAITVTSPNVYNAVEYSEALSYVIGYLTDNEITVNDTWYPNLDDYETEDAEKYGLGYTVEYPKPTFKELFLSLSVLYNTYFVITDDDGDVKFKVVTEDDLHSDTVAIIIPATSDQKIRLNTSYIYTSGVVGDTKTDYDEIYAYVGSTLVRTYIEWSGYDSVKETTFTSDITSGGVSRRIECPYGYQFKYMFPKLDNGDIILVQAFYDGSDYVQPAINMDQEQTTYYDPVPFNELGAITNYVDGAKSLQNRNIMARYKWMTDIYHPAIDIDSCSIVLYPNDGFEVSTDTIDNDEVVLLGTNNSGVDGYRNYYLIPCDQPVDVPSNQLAYNEDEAKTYASSGLAGMNEYNIGGRMKGTAVNGVASVIDLSARLVFIITFNGNRYYYSSVSLFTPLSPNSSTTFNLQFSVTLRIPSGAGIQASIEIEREDPEATLDFAVALESNETTSESFILYNRESVDKNLTVAGSPDDCFAYEVDVEAPVSITDWLTLYNDPVKAVQILSPHECTGWVKDLSYNPSKGMMKGTLITNHTNLYPA